MPREGKTRHGSIRHSKEEKKRRLKRKAVTVAQKTVASHPCQADTVSSATSTVSSNWKNLAKQLGLDASRSKRDQLSGADKRKPAKESRFNSTFAATRKRWTVSTEAPCPKRIRMDGVGADRYKVLKVGAKEVWSAEKVSDAAKQSGIPEATNSVLVSGRDTNAGRCVSLDCEMVGTGPEGDFSMLARCSIVNHHGNVLYDSYVAPMDKITDYRTQYSGITHRHLQDAPDFKSVQKEVSELIKDRLLVGHAINHDLKALLLSHPRKDIRDTSKFKQFRQLSKGKTPSLKKLAKEVLDVDIHQQHHDSIEDARVVMRLYQTHKKEWESILKSRRRGSGH